MVLSKSISIFDKFDKNDISEFAGKEQLSWQIVQRARIYKDLFEYDKAIADYEKYLTKLANNKVTQLQCSISSNPGIKGNSVYVEHIGMQPDIATMQYIFWINNNDMISVTLTCDFYNCAQDRVVFNNLVSSIKY